jgi:hypothetical protein
MHTNENDSTWKGQEPRSTKITKDHKDYAFMVLKNQVNLDNEPLDDATPLEINYLVEDNNEGQ